jgi:hypothetical protein
MNGNITLIPSLTRQHWVPVLSNFLCDLCDYMEVRLKQNLSEKSRWRNKRVLKVQNGQNEVSIELSEHEIAVRTSWKLKVVETRWTLNE